MRIEVKEFGINVVILEPGAIETHFYDVMSSNMPKESTRGPYKKLVSAFTNIDPSTMRGSPPSVISQTIQQIIESESPKRRYVVGRMARPMMMLRRWGGDRIYEFMLDRMIR